MGYSGRLGTTHRQSVQVSCDCGEIFVVELHRGIDAASDPALLEELFQGALHQVHCEACGRDVAAESPVIIHHPSREIFAEVHAEADRTRALALRGGLLQALAGEAVDVPLYVRDPLLLFGRAQAADAYRAGHLDGAGRGRLAAQEEALAERERGLAERERALEENEQGLEERDVGVDERERSVGEGERALVEREQVLQERENELEQTQIEASAASEQIRRKLEDLEKELAERQRPIQSREHAAAEREKAVAAREEELGRRAERLEQREGDLADWQRELEARQRRVEEREHDAEALEQALDDHAVTAPTGAGPELSGSDTAVVERPTSRSADATVRHEIDGAMADGMAALAAQRDALESDREDLDGRKDRLDSREEQISAREEALSRRERELAEARRNLEKMQASSESRGRVDTEPEGHRRFDAGGRASSSGGESEPSSHPPIGAVLQQIQRLARRSERALLPTERGVVAAATLEGKTLKQAGKVEIETIVQLRQGGTYPVVVLSAQYAGADGSKHELAAWPLDVANAADEPLFEALSKEFVVELQLLDVADSARRLSFTCVEPLAENLRYVRSRAEALLQSSSGVTTSFKKAAAAALANRPDDTAPLQPPIAPNSFADLHSPKRAMAALEVVAHWSAPESFDYLIAVRAFPLVHYRAIVTRVLARAVEFGLALDDVCTGLALAAGLARTREELLATCLANFGEVGLRLKPNDLKPRLEHENWGRLLERARLLGIAVDSQYESVAEGARRRAEAQTERRTAPRTIRTEGSTEAEPADLFDRAAGDLFDPRPASAEPSAEVQQPRRRRRTTPARPVPLPLRSAAPPDESPTPVVGRARSRAKEPEPLIVRSETAHLREAAGAGRIDALLAMCESGDPEDMDVLTKGMQRAGRHELLTVLPAALEHRREDRRLISFLLESLASPNAALRQASALSLAILRTPRAHQPLLELLLSEENDMAAEVALAFGLLGVDAIPGLRRAAVRTTQANKQERERLAKALAHIGARGQEKLVQSLLTEEGGASKVAARAVKIIPGIALELVSDGATSSERQYSRELLKVTRELRRAIVAEEAQMQGKDTGQIRPGEGEDQAEAPGTAAADDSGEIIEVLDSDLLIEDVGENTNPRAHLGGGKS